jgi:DNA-binding MarR family transcriptional regulator
MATTAAQETELAGALVQTMHVLQDLYAETSRPLGLTELSRILSIERSSLTSMVDRLERRDLVTRIPDPKDRRAYQIELTTPGLSLANEAHQAFTTRIDALTKPLTPTARRTLATTLMTVFSES